MQHMFCFYSILPDSESQPIRWNKLPAILPGYWWRCTFRSYNRKQAFYCQDLWMAWLYRCRETGKAYRTL